MLNAVLYVVENGCKWRSLPKEQVDWHVIYVRVNRWAKSCLPGTAVMDRKAMLSCGSSVRLPIRFLS